MKLVLWLLLCLSTIQEATNTTIVDRHLPQLNVLLLIADDLGIGDLSCYGNKNIKTPNLDLLASEGIRFNRMYSFPSDSGSMSAILTGQQPRKFGLVKGIHKWTDFWSPAQSGGLLPGGKNIGRMFIENQMNSFYSGRWVLGFQSDSLPTSSGFLSFFGTLGSHSMGCSKQNNFSDTSLFWHKITDFAPIILSLTTMILISKFHSVIKLRTCILLLSILLTTIGLLRVFCWMTIYNPNACIFMENNVIMEQPYNEDKLSLRLTKNAVHFFNYRAKNYVPFLYVMSFLQPKFPHLRASQFKNKTKSPYYDAVVELDWSIGKVLQALEKNNMKNNTLVIFVSDNAQSFTHPVTKLPLPPHQHGSNNFKANKMTIKLRGEKGSNMEGGLRIPAIIRLPGKIKPNSETNVVTSLTDIYPTILDYYNIEKTMDDRLLDGKSLYPVFDNPSLFPSSSLHDQLYHYCDTGPVGAVTVGNLKILFRNGTETDCSGPVLEAPLIFNISSDPKELHPLPIEAHMPLLYHIKASLKKYEMTANLHKMKSAQYDEIPNPLDFPCVDIFDCTKTYDDEAFSALFHE
ncbi:steryl-sulfatase-like [Saccostrea echinata]|uniref:steryl-sulfatase-like n=1 Tax=Saccostrea echinata TaxID=191078 RepID=UPI002A807F8F|nr:steryl-sulfatase-like [Saccostrea echinata]